MRTENTFKHPCTVSIHDLLCSETKINVCVIQRESGERASQAYCVCGCVWDADLIPGRVLLLLTHE